MIKIVIGVLCSLALVHGLGAGRSPFGLTDAPAMLQRQAPAAMQGVKAPVVSWIKQKLDHFNPQELRTWEQRYFVNDQFYSPGGPIFVMINVEGPANLDWLRGGQMMELALFYNAKTFLLEQRFYGESKPTKDTTTANMDAYFNSKQSIEDLATLVTAVRIIHPGAKVVVFGGSFAGNLATWARQARPDIIDAAVVSSAPLLAKFDFFEYFEVVTQVMGNASVACVDDMRAATKEVADILHGENGAKTIASMFSLCSPIDPDNLMDVMNFFMLFANIFASSVQSARSIADVQDYCDLVTNPLYGATPVDRLVEFVVSIYRPSPCLKVRYQLYVDAYVKTAWNSPVVVAGRRQYLYLTCREFGDFQTSSSPIQPFGDVFRSGVFVQICKDYYDENYSAQIVQANVDKTNIDFGGVSPQIDNVVFVQGSLDPYCILGVKADLSENATTIVIEGSSHISDMGTSHVTDSAALKEARLKINALVGQWIKP